MTTSERLAFADHAAARLLADVERLTVAWHPGAATLTRTLARQAREQGRAGIVLAGLGVHPSAVHSRLYRAGLPSVKSQLSAFRLALVLRLAQQSISVKEIAYQMEYSSPPSLGRHIRGRMGITSCEFIARWTPEAFWTECVGSFMLWDDERWTKLDALDSPTLVAVVAGWKVAEGPAPRLSYQWQRVAS